ncbi:2,3-bisphosphoglycerate-dependent phosphoglycerate mutase [Corynebacterium oculi]|uniref:2,3-bisphosphoglycerate-dependent phosphoglycerate mutase n=2 Tax=Corynebacterium oculi TaxID=1544416 RepID=A0A0Q1DW61_9CORY|nr:2,3-bisphosphoglycerate-dependent phosphoglycerate mutase [Corynebacterium oculi]
MLGNMSNGKLILLRHGQSEWNASNQFTGWVDVNLTEKGEAEARRGGELMKESGLKPQVLYTSLLRRAIRTANIALDATDRLWIPVERDWRLNERHYGALQGLNKAETREKYGDEQFMEWRRSYGTPPPELAEDSEYSQAHDPRYADLPQVPATECLKDVVERLVPYFEEEILPRVKRGEVVMVAAHGNSLRALVKYLDSISDADIAELNIPTGIPLVYEIDAEGAVVNPGGTYLDPEAAAAGAAAVASQGAQK